MNGDFVKVLALLMFICSSMLEAIDEKDVQDKEKEYQYISIGLTLLYGIYMFADLQTDGVIFSVLPFIQDYWSMVFVYILLAAIAPPLGAWLEHRKGTFRMESDYALNNLKFNLLGVAAADSAFLLAHFVVGDFSDLKGFYVEDLVPTLASVTVWMVLLYQKTEQRKDRAGGLDHDASLRNVNQKLNLLHLFNVYFLAMVSVVYIVAYTIYCQTYHMGAAMEVKSLILLSIMLVFFYVLSQHPHRYLYLISIIVIPVILISCIYWMTWISPGQEMRSFQWVFIVAHSLVYMLLIFRREKVVTVRSCEEEEASECKEGERYKVGKRIISTESGFLLIFPLVILMLYIIVWRLPFSIDRLPANEAYNYIDMICTDTDMDAEDVIKEAVKQEMYDETDQSFDIAGFMRFLSKELEEQLLEKGIIEESGDVPARKTLEECLKNQPLYK